jgi:hypothetical protein
VLESFVRTLGSTVAPGVTMRRYLMLYLLPAVCCLQACSTTPVSGMEARPVPSERVFVDSNASCDNCGTVVLTRDSGFMGAACAVTAIYDGQKVAVMNPGEVVSFPAAPGQHVLEADPGFCAGNRVGVSVLVEPRRRVVFHIARDQNGSMMLMPSY